MDTLQQVAAAMEDGTLDTQKLVRVLLESALNAIMDEQADMACEGGANSRNGYRERGLLTPAGRITLRILKLRCGTYFPDGILERYSRVDKAVAAAVAEMYATGVSTRKVERIAAKLGIDRLSESESTPIPLTPSTPPLGGLRHPANWHPRTRPGSCSPAPSGSSRGCI